MAKRNKKRDNSKHIRELSLLMPSFSYMWDRLEKINEEDNSHEDVQMAKAVAQKMAFVIRRFSIPTQQKALDLSNRCMIKASDKFKELYTPEAKRIDEHGGIKVNVFSLGLGLFGMHHEHKNKVIHIGMIKELIELQDYSERNIDLEEINISYKYSDIVYNYAMKLPIV